MAGGPGNKKKHIQENLLKFVKNSVGLWNLHWDHIFLLPSRLSKMETSLQSGAAKNIRPHLLQLPVGELTSHEGQDVSISQPIPTYLLLKMLWTSER